MEKKLKHMLKSGCKYYYRDPDGVLREASPGSVYELTELQAKSWRDLFVAVPEGAMVAVSETGEYQVVARPQPDPVVAATNVAKPAAVPVTK